MANTRLPGLTAVALGALALCAALAAAQDTAITANATTAGAGGERKHLFGGQYDPRSPAAEPAAVKPEWAGLIGTYGWEMARFYVIEDDGELKILAGWFDLETLHPAPDGAFRTAASGPHGAQTITFQRDATNQATGAEIGGVLYKRLPFDGPEQFFKIAPVRPVADLRREALASKPPVEAGSFRKPDLVELNRLDDTIRLDIRYATDRNFLGAALYLQARAYMERPAAEAVVRASHRLHELGYGLLIHDAYRPWYVTRMFWVGVPPEKRGFVANPAKGSKHNRGCAVDLTLYRLKSGEPVRMTGGYDEMTERSYPFYPGGTSSERWHRDLLRHDMEAEGFTVDGAEWWHFDLREWREYPILNLTFEQLDSAKP